MTRKFYDDVTESSRCNAERFPDFIKLLICLKCFINLWKHINFNFNCSSVNDASQIDFVSFLRKTIVGFLPVYCFIFKWDDIE
jgi:hypothetical protein